MRAQTMVKKIVAEFGTNDVYAIAEKSGVKIFYENWYPVTIGEYERKTRTIRVNRRALTSNKDLSVEKIIAHELGHFFAVDLNYSREEEERFARRFAEILTEAD